MSTFTINGPLASELRRRGVLNVDYETYRRWYEREWGTPRYAPEPESESESEYEYEETESEPEYIPPPPPPLTIDYKNLLGAGAFCAVYDGWFKGERVAVKRLHSSHRGTLANEFNIMQKIDSTNVLKAVAYTKDLRIIVLKRCTPLNTYLDEKNWKLWGYERLDLLKQLNLGLCAIHEQNIIHRDIKIENCLYVRNLRSGQYIFKIGDFGVAREVPVSNCLQDNNVYMTGRMGTWAYMAPEIVRGRWYNHRADQWSLGVLFFMIRRRNEDPQVNSPQLHAEWVRRVRAFALNLTAEPFKTVMERILHQDKVQRWSSSNVNTHLNYC